MRLYKVVNDGYVVSIGIGCGGIEISEDEYNDIMYVIHTCPNEDGKEYKLRADLTWESSDVPIYAEEPIIQ